jgi:hypothetical protein
MRKSALLVVALALLATQSVCHASTITGTGSAANNSASTQTFSFSFLLPVFSTITNPVMNGSIAGTVTDRNGNDATISAVTGESLHTARIDGVIEHTLLDFPFSQSAGGALQTSSFGPTTFGIPTPIAASQNADSTIEFAVKFNLTAGDAATFSGRFEVVQGPPPNVVPLPMAAWAGMALIGGVGVQRAARRPPCD